VALGHKPVLWALPSGRAAWGQPSAHFKWAEFSPSGFECHTFVCHSSPNLRLLRCAWQAKSFERLGSLALADKPSSWKALASLALANKPRSWGQRPKANKLEVLWLREVQCHNGARHWRVPDLLGCSLLTSAKPVLVLDNIECHYRRQTKLVSAICAHECQTWMCCIHRWVPYPVEHLSLLITIRWWVIGTDECHTVAIQ
jgi:hypothetical protein